MDYDYFGRLATGSGGIELRQDTPTLIQAAEFAKLRRSVESFRDAENRAPHSAREKCRSTRQLEGDEEVEALIHARHHMH